jgi:outer membrane protein assembly factor BamE (lipoprotein component of BamABCDE complex)
MKTRLGTSLLLITASLWLFSGCRTSTQTAAATARIQEKSETFSKLSPEQQKRIQEGWIERGYTPDMVYMVMGNPSTVARKDTNGRPLEMWTYIEYSRPGSGALDTRNNPGNPHYTTQTVATISALVRDIGGPTSAQVKPAEFSSSSASMGPLNVADLERSKVYLFFAGGRVAEIKLESEG